MKLPWTTTIAAIIVALFFWWKATQYNNTLKDISRDYGIEIETLKARVSEEKVKLLDLTKEKIKLEKDYLDKLAEYKRIIDSKGTETVVIQRIDTVQVPMLWTMVDTVERFKMPENYIGDIFKYEDQWSKFRAYYDGFMVNMDYDIRDSISFNVIEDKEGWYIKGRSMNPATKVSGLDKLVKKEYPIKSVWGYGTAGAIYDGSFRSYGGVGIGPEFEYPNMKFSFYGESQVFTQGQVGVELGVRVGVRFK